VASRKPDDGKVVEPLAKVANLVALLLTKDANAGDQIVTLARAGYTNQEIADLVGSTAGNVAQALYLSRKVKVPKRPKKN
jgi:hypothetical protein